MANETGNMCRFCGEPMIYNPNTQKEFCSAKCWLQNQPQQPTRTSYTQPHVQQYRPPQPQNQQSAYDKKEKNKQRLIAWQMCFKEANSMCIAKGLNEPQEVYDLAQKYWSLLLKVPWNDNINVPPPPEPPPPVEEDEDDLPF